MNFETANKIYKKKSLIRSSIFFIVDSLYFRIQFEFVLTEWSVKNLTFTVKSFPTIFVNIFIVLWYITQGFYGVMVSTLDSESSDPSSSLGRTFMMLISYSKFEH